jgi:hypothetical protein
MLCPHCQTHIPTEGLDAQQWVTCGKCDATVQLPDDQHADASLATSDTFFEDRKVAHQQMFRSFRFQSFVVASLVTTVVLLILGYTGYRAKQRSDVVASIQELGGVVLYDYQFSSDHGRYKFAAEPQTAVWLTKKFGPNLVFDVTAIDLGRKHAFLQSERFGSQDLTGVDVPDFEPAVKDDQLKRLSSIESLQLLSLAGQPITDKGVRRLKHFERLVFLDLSDTKITDASVADLGAIRQLKFLDLRGTAITRAAFRKLERALPHTEILRGRAFVLH